MTKAALRIFEILEEREISDYYYCKMTGTSRGTLSAWRNDDINPSENKIAEVCRIANITQDEFYNGGIYAETDSSGEITDYLRMKEICKKLAKLHKAEAVIPFLEYVLRESS